MSTTTPTSPFANQHHLTSSLVNSRLLGPFAALPQLFETPPTSPNDILTQLWPFGPSGESTLFIELGVGASLTGLTLETYFLLDDSPLGFDISGLSSSTPLPFEALSALPEAAWTLLDAGPALKPHHLNPIHLGPTPRLTHVRIRLASGLLTRVHLFGTPKADWSQHTYGELEDLASLRWGGKVLATSTGSPSACPLNQPNPQGQTWDPPSDQVAWAIIQLGRASTLSQLIVDLPPQEQPHTQLLLEGLFVPGATLEDLYAKTWKTLLPLRHLPSGQRHHLTKGFEALGPLTHVRLKLRPGLHVRELQLLGDEGEL